MPPPEEVRRMASSEEVRRMASSEEVRRMASSEEVSQQVLGMMYHMMAVTGLGYLALMWSTVVLLGGFVTSLGNKDFWCLTVISLVQAARIFNELAEQQLHSFMNIVQSLELETISVKDEIQNTFTTFCHEPILSAARSTWWSIGQVLFVLVIYVPVLAVCYTVVLLYRFGPTSCIVLALWRLGQRDYGSKAGADLLPAALNIFYLLVICQGMFYLLWFMLERELVRLLCEVRAEFKLPKKDWSHIFLVEYLFDIQARCRQDHASFHGRTLCHYAVDLLISGSWEDNILGARVLDLFIQQGTDLRSMLLPSRSLIQKLIDTMGWRNGPQGQGGREMRELAARIVVHIAGEIHLAQVPGAIRCISSLLQEETTGTYWHKSHQHGHLHRCNPPKKRAMILRLQKAEQKYGDHQQEEVDSSSGDSSRGGGSCNELILQGLTILESLASDHHNCRDICSNPGLLTKIMAPIYSATLIQDIKNKDWADVVNRSLKVLNQLISAPGKTCRRLRREISINKEAVTNLDCILDQHNGASPELQMRAMEVLTHLALDLSINLSSQTKENLIEKQLQIFLADEAGEGPSMCNPLKAAAAEALALMSTNTENSVFIMKGYDDILRHLTEKLDANNIIIYRIKAAYILGNLCANCTLDKEHVKETLLKVLSEIVSTTREPPQSEISTTENEEENQEKCALEQDEENPCNISTRVNTEIQAISSAMEQSTTKAVQESFLSLTLVIYDKIISADDFDDLGCGAFVALLKSIVDENCQASADSLRIVKLCGQIAVSMMRRNQYTAHFKDQNFVQSLSRCSEIMSNLESCMLFSRTDFGQNNTIRPLFYEINKEALGLVNC